MTRYRVLTDDDYAQMELDAENEREAAAEYDYVMAHGEQQSYRALAARVAAGELLSDIEQQRYAQLVARGHPWPEVTKPK